MTTTRSRRRCTRCQTPLAADNRDDICSPCAKNTRASPFADEVPHPSSDFWEREDVLSAVAARHFGRLLRVYRKALGLRQFTVAEWLGVTQGQLSRLERADAPVTDLVKLERWSRTLCIPQELLWFTLSAQSSDTYDSADRVPKLPPVHVTTTGENVHRRQFLTSAGAGAATVGASLLAGASYATASGAVGAPHVEEVREMTAAFRAADNQYGGAHSRSALKTYFETTVEPMLDDTRIVGALQRELFTAAAEMRQLAGWMAYDVGQPDEGRKHLREALRLCEKAGDDALAAEMFAAMSHQAAFVGAGDSAVDLAIAAHQAAVRVNVPALRAESAVMEAHGLAMQNDPRACFDALRRAEVAFGQIAADATPKWLAYFDGSYMAAKFAHAFCDLGQPKEAERFARRSLDMSAGYNRGKLFNTALLASALADQRRVDEACSYGMTAVHMAGNVRSQRATAYLSDLSRRLAPFKSAPVRTLYTEMDKVGIATPRV